MSDQAEHIAIECGECNKHVSAPVLGVTIERDLNDDVFRVLLVQCPLCSTAIVAGQTIDRIGLDEWNPEAPRRLWPQPARELSFDAPAGVRRDFDEAQRCLSVGANTGAALLARRVLEGIATNLGATKFNLGAKLEELKASGAIDGRLADWSRALVVVGNDAAHDVANVVSRDDASAALTFAEALADYVYTFRAQYDRFVARRDAQSKPSPEDPF